LEKEEQRQRDAVKAFWAREQRSTLVGRLRHCPGHL
jgi:hypothetical protein